MNQSRRWLLVVVTGLVGAAVTVLAHVYQGEPSDFAQAWHGARFLMEGRDPYALIGPGREVEQGYGLFYPLPALLFVVPLAGLVLVAAKAIFYGLGAAAMMAVFSRDANDPRMLLTVSGAFLFSAVVAQWEPWLVAAALSPAALGFLLVAKPTVGAALWVAYPSWRSVATGAVVVGVSVAVWPEWPLRWLESTKGAPITRPLALTWLGWLPLAALYRWREGDARLVAALSLVPITPLPYSAVLLFPAAKHMREVVALIVGTWLLIAVHRWGVPYPSNEARLDWMREWFAALVTVPMAALILARPWFTRHVAGAAGDSNSSVPLTASQRSTEPQRF